PSSASRRTVSRPIPREPPSTATLRFARPRSIRIFLSRHDGRRPATTPTICPVPLATRQSGGNLACHFQRAFRHFPQQDLGRGLPFLQTGQIFAAWRQETH